MNNRLKSGVSVIVPAYNEEDYIEETIKNIPDDYEVIIVNDGSTDKTARKVKKYPVILINLSSNYGKGYAISRGLEYASGSIIVLADADLGTSANLLRDLVKPVKSGEADVVIGTIKIKGGGLGLVRLLAHHGLKWMTGKTMASPLSGQRAINREVLSVLKPLSSGFGLEIGMDLDIIRNNIRYKEVECDIRHRVTDKSLKGYWHRGKQFTHILYTMWLKRR
ncbi:glycosyl transferase family 2 [Halothermothrix orenii H 168]|uniref:Glucosyl-3-phosphoglycerate synthase n=1 Tax=Halothermothrix orenii (strain H 168 / OCM 544 / DSM 9562) TaxID=373903 RepID=B8D2J2_HALOH|nr:glycosyl transferase family 2 [Halothermothrix orenii H 168]